MASASSSSPFVVKSRVSEFGRCVGAAGARRVQGCAGMGEMAWRPGLVLVAAISVAGCSLAGLPGLREETSGACPVGETCSSEAPKGLFFLGAAFSDDVFGAEGLSPVAAGGRETITALAGDDADNPTFTGSFLVTDDNSGVLTVGAVTPPSFEVDGQVAGTSLIKLLDPAKKDLLDEVDVKVETLERVTVVPLELPSLEAPTWALLAGGAKTPLLTELHGAGKHRLVDETTTLTPDFGPASRKAWDLF